MSSLISTKAALTKVAKRSVGIAAEFEPTHAHWVPDSKATHCAFEGCGAKFGAKYTSLSLRKHHCRRCGYLFCDNHSKQRLRLNASAEPALWGGGNCRVCDTCYADGLMVLQRLEHEQHVAAAEQQAASA